MAAQKVRFRCNNCYTAPDGIEVVHNYHFSPVLDQGLPENNIWVITPTGEFIVTGIKNVFEVGTIYEFTIRKLGES